VCTFMNWSISFLSMNGGGTKKQPLSFIISFKRVKRKWEVEHWWPVTKNTCEGIKMSDLYFKGKKLILLGGSLSLTTWD